MPKPKRDFIALTFDENHDFIVCNLQVLYQILEKKYHEEGGPWGFKNDVFEMNDGRSMHEDDAAPDFVCGDIKIKWYKHIGRGMEINRSLDFEGLQEMFDQCRESLRQKR